MKTLYATSACCGIGNKIEDICRNLKIVSKAREILDDVSLLDTYTSSNPFMLSEV